jgi:hypothetical protein
VRGRTPVPLVGVGAWLRVRGHGRSLVTQYVVFRKAEIRTIVGGLQRLCTNLNGLIS